MEFNVKVTVTTDLYWQPGQVGGIGGGGDGGDGRGEGGGRGGGRGGEVVSKWVVGCVDATGWLRLPPARPSNPPTHTTTHLHTYSHRPHPKRMTHPPIHPPTSQQTNVPCPGGSSFNEAVSAMVMSARSMISSLHDGRGPLLGGRSWP